MTPPHASFPTAPRRLLLLLWVLAVAALALLPARASLAAGADPTLAAAESVDAVAAGQTAAADPAPMGYAVGPGDTLYVQVYGEDSLTGAVPVSDTGAIDFPLLGSVQVAGLTAPDVAELLHRRLAAGFILDPEVTVRIDSFGSQPIQVLGAVDKPGVYYVRGTTTVLEMLTQAGGVLGEGVNEVRVTQASQGGEVMVMPFVSLVSEGRGNIEVHGGDVIFVPETLVYVMGEVQKPGSVAYRDELTVSRCIAAAGGAAQGANLGRVWILRGDTRIRVNVRRILKGKADDVFVESGDQIFVESSVL